MSAAHGVVLALLARTRTRRGQKVEISMLDVMASLLTYQAGIYFGTGARPARRGNAHPSIVPYEVFRAADAFVVLGVANNSLWLKCCAALGHPELATDPRFDAEAKRVQNRATLVPLLNEIMGTRPAADWVKQFEAAGIPAGLIKSVAEVCESEHLKARGMIVSLPHPRAKKVTGHGCTRAPARDARGGRDAAARYRPAHGHRAPRSRRAQEAGGRALARAGRHLTGAA
jgi:crotonobetainyl-CoA:carnitine CoA-transferase CaiB-like acyl-CoA transferase